MQYAMGIRNKKYTEKKKQLKNENENQRKNKYTNEIRLHT